MKARAKKMMECNYGPRSACPLDTVCPAGHSQATQTSPCLDAKGNLWYALEKGDTLGQFHLDHISRQVQGYQLGANQGSDWDSLGNGDLGDSTGVRCYSQGMNPRARGGCKRHSTGREVPGGWSRMGTLARAPGGTVPDGWPRLAGRCAR